MYFDYAQYKQKGQILIWVIVGSLIIAIVGGAYYLRRQITPNASPSPSIVSNGTPVNNNYVETKPIDNCSNDSDCILAQDGYCGIVISINKNYQNEWVKQDELDTKKAISQKQTCKVSTPESHNINNYISSCDTRRKKCTTEPKF